MTGNRWYALTVVFSAKDEIRPGDVGNHDVATAVVQALPGVTVIGMDHATLHEIPRGWVPPTPPPPPPTILNGTVVSRADETVE